MNSSNRQRKGFNLIAPIYEPLMRSVFGNSLRNMEYRLMDMIPSNKDILIVGEGNGVFLGKFVKLNHPSSITVVDLSDKMCELSRNRIKRMYPAQLKIDYVVSDILQFRTDKKFDIIITNFFLDLFDPIQLEKIMLTCDSFLKSDGLWYFTDFYDRPGTGLPSFVREIIMKPIYSFFAFLTGISGRRLPDFCNYFSKLNYSLLGESLHATGLFRCAVYRKVN